MNMLPYTMDSARPPLTSRRLKTIIIISSLLGCCIGGIVTFLAPIIFNLFGATRTSLAIAMIDVGLSIVLLLSIIGVGLGGFVVWNRKAIFYGSTTTSSSSSSRSSRCYNHVNNINKSGTTCNPRDGYEDLEANNRGISASVSSDLRYHEKYNSIDALYDAAASYYDDAATFYGAAASYYGAAADAYEDVQEYLYGFGPSASASESVYDPSASASEYRSYPLDEANLCKHEMPLLQDVGRGPRYS